MQATSALTLYRSTIGKKAIMAVTGLIGIGFLFFHMYGNLKIFLGQEYFNAYAEGLRGLGAPIFMHTHLLWLMRIVLLAAVALHVWAALSLWLQARRARPQSYEMKRVVQANYASRTIRWGGLVVFFFILFHLAQLTWGATNLPGGFDRTDPYSNVIAAFQSPLVVAFYLIALFVLAFHLYHGTWSFIQTLGFLHKKWDRLVRLFALLVAIVIPGGLALVPISVIAGFIH